MESIRSSSREEEKDIVIIGGGICGLATALALHRKGIASLVLERSEGLRAYGLTIMIRNNGWLALDYLGVASNLRSTALPLHLLREKWLDKGFETQSQISKGEARCVKRSDLMETLACDLPNGTIRFGSRVLSINSDSLTSLPIVHLHDGSIIKAKIVIGCDGVNSVVADFLGLRPAQNSAKSSVRGLTNYPDGHEFGNEYDHLLKNNTLIGRIPITPNLLYWYVTRQWHSRDTDLFGNQEEVKRSCLKSAEGFPPEVSEMIKQSNIDSLTLSRFKYRPPWELIFLGSFRRGTVTVAGDAMHVMNPFLGQGGAASIEDGIVIARCLAQKLKEINPQDGRQLMVKKVGEAFDQYLKERRLRVFKLSLQSHLKSKLLEPSSLLTKLVVIFLFFIFFRDRIAHSKYDCGPL